MPRIGDLESHGRSVLTEYVSNLGSLLEFKKTNDETREFLGAKVYILHFRAATRLGQGVYFVKDTVGQTAIARCDETLSGFLWPTATELSAGTTYVLAGEMMFRSTERGWLYQNWKRKSLALNVPARYATGYLGRRAR